MEAQALQQTIRLDVLESYYIESKFRFHVISPAIVDEGDYMTSVDEERKSRGNTPPAQKKKDEKSKQTILLIAIKKGEVYSYVRETKLGKILGLSSKFIPRAISKHGLFIFAVEKKLNNFAVYEMTSGNLVKLITKPHISSMQGLIPYVSEDGNFAILFDKERFKLFFIYGIQQKNESDHAIDLKFEHNDNFKLIDYPDLGGDTYKGIVFYPFKYRAIDCALGIKADGTRVFTMSMLLESKRGEVVVCIVRIHTTDKAYKGHTIKLFHLEPSLHRDAGLYSLRLDDKDGDYLAVHCHNHHNSNSILYFMKPAKIQAESQDVTCLKFEQSKIIIEYQWVSIQQMKYLVYITRQLEIHVVDPEGEQVLFYFNQKAKNSIHLLSIFRRKVLEFSAIQLFNVNTEANLVLFFDKNIVSMDFSSFGDSRVTEGQQVPAGYTLESRKLILFDVIGDSTNPAIENADSKKKLSYVEEMKTEESKPSISAHPSKTGLNTSKKDLNQMSHTSGVVVQDLSKKTSQASIMAHDTSKKDLNQASHRSGMQAGTDINRGRSQVSEPEPDYQRSRSDVPVKKKNWFSSLFKDKSKNESVSPMSGVSFPENKNMKHQKNISEGGMQMTSQSFFGSSKENLREDGSAKKLEQRQSQTKVENIQRLNQEESGRDFQGQGQGQEQPVIYKASTSQENIRGQGPTSSAKSLTVTKVGSGKIFMQDQQEEQNNQKSQVSIMYNNSQATLMKEESKNNIASTKSLFQKQSSAELKSINQINYLNPNAGKSDNIHSGMSKTSITISGAHLNDNNPVDKELTISDTDQIDENLSTSKGLNQPGLKPMRLSHSWTSQQQPHDSKQSSKENLQNFTLVESGVKETKNINKDITKSMWDDLQANDSGNSSLVRSDKHLKKSEDIFEIPVIKREDYIGRKTQSNESKQENVFGFEIDKPSTADYLQPPKSGYMAGGFGLPGNGFSPSFTSPSFGTEEKIQFQNTNDNSTQNANQLKSLMPNRRKSDLQITANNNSTETLRRNEEVHQKSDKKIDFVKKSVWSDEKIIIPGDSISNQSSKKTLEEFLYAEKPDKRKLDKDDTPSKILTKDKKLGSLETSPLMPAPEFLFTESPNKEEKAHQDSSVVTFRRSSPNKGQAEENKKKNGNFAAFRENKISGILEENYSKLNETDIMLGQLVSSPTMGQRVEKVEFGTNRWRLRKSRESQEDGFGSKIREAVNKNPEKDSKDLRQIILGDKKEQTKVQDKKWTDAYGKRDFEEIKQTSSKDLKTEENQKQGKNDQQLFGGFKPQTNFDDFLYGNLTSTTEFKPKTVNVIDSNLGHFEKKASPIKGSWDNDMNLSPDNERNLSNKQKEVKGLDVKAVVSEQSSKTKTIQEGKRDDYYGKLPDASIKNSEVLAPKLTGLKDNKNQTTSPVKVFHTQDQPQELKGYNDFKDFKKSPEPIKTSFRISKDSSNHSESPAQQETIIYRLNETEQSPTREKTKSFQRYNPEPSARSSQTVKESHDYETQRRSDKGASLSPMRQRERDESKSSIEHSGRRLVRSSKEKEGDVSFTVKKDTTKLQAQESIRIVEETKKSIEKSNSIVQQSVEKSKEEESKRERRQSRDFEESRLQSIDNTAKPKESLKELKIEKIEEPQSRPEKDVERNKVERDKSPLVRRYEAKGKSTTALEDKNKDNAVEERKVMANPDHQNEKEESMIEKITEMYSNNNVVESIMINESKLEEIKNFEKQESQEIKDKTQAFKEPENLTKKSIEVELKVHSEFKNKEDTETFIREHTLEYNNHYLPEKLKRDTNKSDITKDVSTGDTRESSRPGSSGRRVRRSSLQEIKQDLSAIVSNKRDLFERAPQKSFASQLNQSEIIIAQTDSSMLGGSILDKSRYNKKEKHTQQLDASPSVSRRREILNTISDKKNIQVYNHILPEKHKTQHQQEAQQEAGNRYSNVRNSRQLWDNNSKGHTKPSLDASIIEETHKDSVQKERKAQGDEVLPEIRSSSRKQKISLTPKQNARASSEQKKSVRISFKEPGQAESASSSKLPIATTSGSKLKGVFNREENSRKSSTRQSKEVNQSKNIRSSITQSKTKILKSSLRKSNPIWRDSTIIKVKTETYDLGKTSNLDFQTIDLTQTEEIAPFGHSSTLTNMHERPSPLEKEGLEPYLKSLFHEEREQETFYQALQMFKDLPSEEGKLLGQLENIIVRFQEEFQGQMSEDLAKKVWLLLVHNLIRVFLKLKKDVKSYPRKHFLKLASMYFFVKDQLQRHIDSKKKVSVRRRQSLQKWQRRDEIPHPDKEQESSNYLQPNRTSGHNLSRRSRSLQPSKDIKNSISQSRKLRQKEAQEGQPAKSLRASTEDIDKEKVIKKILLGLNEDDFNLVKIIKHLQSALVSKATPTHIVGNCFFLFIVFLKSFVSAILDTDAENNTVNVIPAVLYKDILMKITDYTKAEEIESYLESCATKYSKYDRRAVKQDGGCTIRYQDLNVTDLLLYLVNFLNYPRMFIDIAQIFIKADNIQVAGASKYLIMILMFLNDKLELFTSKFETLRIVRDKAERSYNNAEMSQRTRFEATADEIRFVIGEMLDILIGLNVSSDSENSHSSMVEPERIVSLPVCLADMEVLKPDSFVLERSCFKIFSELNEILQSLKQANNTKNFWMFVLANMNHCFDWQWFDIKPLGLGTQAQDIDIKCRDVTKDMKEKAFVILRSIYELSYFLNWKSFGANGEESPGPKPYLRALYRVARSMFYCYLKVQIELTKLVNNKSKEEYVVTYCRRGLFLCNLLVFPEYKEYEHQAQVEDELITVLETLNENERFIQPSLWSSLEWILQVIEFCVPSIMKMKCYRDLMSKKEETSKFSAEEQSDMNENSIIRALFPKASVLKKRTMRESELADSNMEESQTRYKSEQKRDYIETTQFNSFLQKILNLQATEQRESTGFEDFYLNQKDKCKEVIDLYSKMEQKYAPIFANQKKQTSNLLFDEGLWNFIVFPSEIKRFPQSRF